jgi:hypothetical protein
MDFQARGGCARRSRRVFGTSMAERSSCNRHASTRCDETTIETRGRRPRGEDPPTAFKELDFEDRHPPVAVLRE